MVAVGDVVDLCLGRDALTGTREWIRLRCIEHFAAPEQAPIARVRFDAIGGGPTNVPRWERWEPVVYDLREVESMLRTGTMRRASCSSTAAA
jgi:hypothetical protein